MLLDEMKDLLGVLIFWHDDRFTLLRGFPTWSFGF